MAVGVTLAATGMAIAIVGSITSVVIAADTYDPETGTGAEFYGVAIGTRVVGTLLAVAGIPSLTTHSRARKYPSMALTESQADALISAHNAALSSP
jgi:hypothetical protein